MCDLYASIIHANLQVGSGTTSVVSTDPFAVASQVQGMCDHRLFADSFADMTSV